MLALLLMLLACSSETPVPSEPMDAAVPQDNIRAAGEVMTSTYVIFAPGQRDHLVPLACFDTSSLNSGRGANCLDHMGLERVVQLEDNRMVTVDNPSTLECKDSQASTSALKSQSPLGTGVHFGIWPSLEAAHWTPRSEESVKPGQLRPLIEKATETMLANGLSPSEVPRIQVHSVLQIDLEGDGREDALVEAIVLDPQSQRVTMSAIFLGGGGGRPFPLTAPNLEIFGHTRVIGATRTTSEGAWLVLLESKLPTRTGWSVVQRTERGFIARGSWACDGQG
jgi:hypothetical protein